MGLWWGTVSYLLNCVQNTAEKRCQSKQTEKFSLPFFYDNYHHTDVGKMIPQLFYWPTFSQLWCFSPNISTKPVNSVNSLCDCTTINTYKRVQKVNDPTTANGIRVLTR